MAERLSQTILTYLKNLFPTSQTCASEPYDLSGDQALLEKPVLADSIITVGLRGIDSLLRDCY